MKKNIALVLALIMVLCVFAACGKDSAADPGFDAVKSAVLAAVDSEGLQDIPAAYVENTMKLGSDAYSEACLRISNTGTSIDEFGVFKTDDAEALKALLEAYLSYRNDIWMDEYLPEEFPKLENAKLWVVGDYVMYVILGSDAAGSAETAFKGCFEG